MWFSDICRHPDQRTLVCLSVSIEVFVLVCFSHGVIPRSRAAYFVASLVAYVCLGTPACVWREGDGGGGGAGEKLAGGLGGSLEAGQGGAPSGGGSWEAGGDGQGANPVGGGQGGVAEGQGEFIPITLPPGSSCAGGLDCGGLSCCDNRTVPGGTFLMGRGDASDGYPWGNDDELPEHEVFVDGFALDTFEVTVGRFRKFVDSYDSYRPQEGSGAHPKISGSGWRNEWDKELPSNKQDLLDAHDGTHLSASTWTMAPGEFENSPINHITWYQAFAFCIWDGGRLPTEAEWEYVAAGGEENRLYPWGKAPPDKSRGYNACAPLAWPLPCAPRIEPVGTAFYGVSRWGHYDLAGNVQEWVLDMYAPLGYADIFPMGCFNCANFIGERRVSRGGSFMAGNGAGLKEGELMRSASRGTPSKSGPYDIMFTRGFRCARN